MKLHIINAERCYENRLNLPVVEHADKGAQNPEEENAQRVYSKENAHSRNEVSQTQSRISAINKQVPYYA
jgi:hypothetical protein